MSDDERIARLTELARRVYGTEVTVQLHGATARVMHGDAVLLHVLGEHCRDALEAALLTLVGEPPAWVEKLASDWEAEARERSRLSTEAHAADERSYAAYCAGKSAGHAVCAAELRARAKEGA